MTQRTLITSALPYANGPIHLGHLVEHIQTDVYVRFLKLIGREVAHICADDTHGTPIEINARKQGISPETLVARMHEDHTRDFARFDIGFDIYYTTNSPENRRFAELFFEKLKASGHVVRRPLEMFFCEKDQRFLPDRFVRGVCPKCKSADQYGDVCEVCGTTYQPTDLIDPRCALCGTTPVRRESPHYFVRLSDFKESLQRWVGHPGRLQDEIRNFVQSWIDAGLKDWCVSRDGPYFGFPIPGEENKFFYVWLDAPIGYVSSTFKWCEETGRDFDAWWKSDQTEIVHFIGKDIVYFHCLFWPAMLEAAGFTLPSRVNVHGMLKVGGEKMSKSRGKLISAEDLAGAIDPQFLRYYYAASLGPRPDDIEFSLEDLKNRINAELVNNIANFCHRTLTFCKARLGGRLTTLSDAGHAKASVLAWKGDVHRHFTNLDFRKAVQQINLIADFGNSWVQDEAPWTQIKTDREAAARTITVAANVIRILAMTLRPIAPRFAEDLQRQLRVDDQRWEDATFNLENHEIGQPAITLRPIEDEALAKLAPAPESAPAPSPAEGNSGIAFEEFSKVELRVGLVLAAERVPKADKLLKLSVDLGEGAPRTIAAGVAERYTPEQITGKRVVVVANLEPRKIRGIESRGMLLAAEGASVVEVPGDVAPGTRVK